MKIVLPYPPSTNLLWRMFRGRMVKSAEARKFAATVGHLARVAGLKPIVTGPVLVRVDVYRPRRIGDLDNTLKATLDALKGIAWTDDSQIEGIYAWRHEDKEKPRLEIEISAIGATEAA